MHLQLNHSPPDIDVSAANSQASHDTIDFSSHAARQPIPPTSASSVSLSPLTVASDSLHQQNHNLRRSESGSAPTGVVAGASPSFLSTEFAGSKRPRPPAAASQERIFLDLNRHSLDEQPRLGVGSSPSTLLPATSPSDTSSGEHEDANDLAATSSMKRSSRKRDYAASELEQSSSRGRSGAEGEQTRAGSVTFIHKLYDILEDPDNAALISYGRAPGSFKVHNIVSLAHEVLPKYFKHSNFASFSRQLNMWGWRKESRNGGWIFVHPIFRAGRRDLLAHIKRSDESGKKRPETVGSRKKNHHPNFSRPLGAPPKSTHSLQNHRNLSLDTALAPAVSSPFPRAGPTRLHPHSAPASSRPAQQFPSPLPIDSHRSSRPSPPLISPLFNSDGSHTRPVHPPAFLDVPRPHLLPPPVFRGTNATVQRHHSLEPAPSSVQFEELKKRFAMSTSLLEHVLERLGVEEGHEKFRSFPFYVFDPRFQDPSVSMQLIMSDYDARKMTATRLNTTATQPGPSQHGSKRLHLNSPDRGEPPTSRASPRFASSSTFASSETIEEPYRPYSFDDTGSVVEPALTSIYEARNDSFDSSSYPRGTTTSPEEDARDLKGMGIVYGGGATSSSSSSDHHRPYIAPVVERSSHDDTAITVDESSYSPDRPLVRLQTSASSCSSLRRRPSTAPTWTTATTTKTPTLGPASFSLVDFSHHQNASSSSSPHHLVSPVVTPLVTPQFPTFPSS